MQTWCITWLLAYFDVSWVDHGCPRGGRRFHAHDSGRYTMQVRNRGKHTPSSFGAETSILRDGPWDRPKLVEPDAATGILSCALALIEVA